MQGNHLYEYAVIRLVPRAERGECLNVGIILYCREREFLGASLEMDAGRLSAFYPAGVTRPEYFDEWEEHLRAFEKVCRGDADAGPIARLDKASRFRWLTAARSAVIRTSEVHPGFCADPAETLSRLHRELVTLDR